MQGGSSGIVYGGLKYQARCIADVRADAGSTTFLAGTLSLKEENEVHLIRLLPGENELVCDGLFYHPNEIWDLKSCPFDHRLFSTVYTSGEGYGASVWKIPELYGQSNSPQLEELFTLDEHTAKIRCVLWWPLGKHDKLISIDERNIFLWNIDPSNKSAKVISQGSADMLPNFEPLGGVEATARAATTPLLIRLRSARQGRSNRSGGHHASPHPSLLQAAYQMPQSSSSRMSAGAETAVPD